MKANGASASRRFSARLKCTRPTRFQAGIQALEKALQVGFCRGKRRASAAAISCHSARSTSVVRYSAPAIIGAVNTRDASSAVGGCGYFRGWLQAQRGHVARRESAPPQEERRQACPTSPAPSRSNPSPLPRENASASRSAMRASNSGASEASSKTRCPCGVRRRLGCGMHDQLAIGRPWSSPCRHRDSPERPVSGGLEVGPQG